MSCFDCRCGRKQDTLAPHTLRECPALVVCRFRKDEKQDILAPPCRLYCFVHLLAAMAESSTFLHRPEVDCFAFAAHLLAAPMEQKQDILALQRMSCFCDVLAAIEKSRTVLLCPVVYCFAHLLAATEKSRTFLLRKACPAFVTCSPLCKKAGHSCSQV